MGELFSELRERLLRAGVAPRHVRRYLRELADHLADLTAEEERAGRSPTDAHFAALRRLGEMGDLAKAMIDQCQFQSWSARAPWAAFGLAPLFSLAAVWLAALSILWSGWRIFLPGVDTPFGAHVTGFANLYFQLGRALYFGAPIFIGWGVGVLAARQRRQPCWPILGAIPIALLAVTAQVRAARTGVPGQLLGHVNLRFAFGSSTQPLSVGLYHTLLVFLLMLVIMLQPYFIWGSRRKFFAKLSLFCVLASAAFGQPAKPEFDVADIKQNKSVDTGVEGGVIPGGQLSIRNAPLKTLLGFAFYPGYQRFRDKLIVGAPAWVDTDRFDIAPKAPPNAPVRQCFFSNFCYPDTTMALMPQRLLEQRFKLTTHREQRPTQVFALMAAKGGVKLPSSAGSGDWTCRRITGDSDDPAAKGLSPIQGGFVCANMPMARFMELLPDMAGRLYRPAGGGSNRTQGHLRFQAHLGRPSQHRPGRPYRVRCTGKTTRPEVGGAYAFHARHRDRSY